jgi:hypothetical protein
MLMEMDFAIEGGIHLRQPPHLLDLHNDFAFERLDYSVTTRRLRLEWRRRDDDWVRPSTPAAVCLEIDDVAEFRFLARDARMPFTEDDCVATIGYWVDEDWCDGVVMLGPGQVAEPGWLFAIQFHSGAVVAVAAASARAQVQP